MSDVCLHDDGIIVLYPMAGCSQDSSSNNNQMHGVWEKKDGTVIDICWRYEGVIFIYTKDKTLSYPTKEISMDCQAAPFSYPSVQYQDPLSV